MNTGYESIKLKCECGYNFENDTNIDWTCLINEVITCPKCKSQYIVKYDSSGDEEDCQRWWLEKKC